MYGTQLFKILRTFHEDEWKSFELFLGSRHEQHSEIVRIYQFLKKYSHNLDHKQLELERANKSLFKKKTRKSFLNLLSKLHLAALDFITITEFQTEQREYDLYTLIALNRRGVYDKSRRAMDHYQTYMDQRPTDIWDQYYLLRARHELKFSDHRFDEQASIKLKEDLLESYLLLMEHLKTYYLLDAKHMSIVLASSADHLTEKLENTRNQLDDLSLQFVRMRSLLTQQDDALVLEIKEWLKLHQDSILPSIGSALLIHLVQYLQRCRLDSIRSVRLLHELILFGLETRWLLDHGRLAAVRFMNVISISSYLEDREVTSSLRRKYLPCVAEELREETDIHSKMIILTFYGEHESALDMLQETKYSTIKFSSHAKVLTLINYYKLYRDTDPDFLHSQIDNIRRFFQRVKGKYPENSRQACLNLCKVIKDMAREKDVFLVREEIDNMQYLFRRVWLLKELGVLK